jgi:hypothetical protein
MDQFLTEHVYSLIHWPFLTLAVVLMFVTQVLKNTVLYPNRISKKSKYQWMYWWSYKTLPLHPLLMGAVIGCLWVNPENSYPEWPVINSVFYFMMSGALSVSLYQIIKGVFKRRNININFFDNK